jgi:hypothetical protein
MSRHHRLGALPHLPHDAHGSHRLPAWLAPTPRESRWGAASAVVAAIALQLSLPAHLTLPPRWLLPTIGALLLAGVVAADPGRIDRHSRGLRAASVILTSVLSVANSASAARLVLGILDQMAIATAQSLLLWGGAVWASNVVVAGLWYWELDRGGPMSRSEGGDRPPAFLFPQMTNPELAPMSWSPRFFDYLYLSFANATSFAPADAVPLTRWAKAAMLVQTTVSLGTVVLVIARAVSVLG